jgi:hypothetical protein
MGKFNINKKQKHEAKYSKHVQKHSTYKFLNKILMANKEYAFI